MLEQLCRNLLIAICFIAYFSVWVLILFDGIAFFSTISKIAMLIYGFIFSVLFLAISATLAEHFRDKL